jgi:hypothetical protein
VHQVGEKCSLYDVIADLDEITICQSAVDPVIAAYSRQLRCCPVRLRILTLHTCTCSHISKYTSYKLGIFVIIFLMDKIVMSSLVSTNTNNYVVAIVQF